MPGLFDINQLLAGLNNSMTTAGTAQSPGALPFAIGNQQSSLSALQAAQGGITDPATMAKLLALKSQPPILDALSAVKPPATPVAATPISPVSPGTGGGAPANPQVIAQLLALLRQQQPAQIPSLGALMGGS